MLVLTRKSNQSIMIGDEIEVSVLAIMGEKVRIGIEAPRSIPVFRKEVYLEIRQDSSPEETRKEVNKALEERKSPPAADWARRRVRPSARGSGSRSRARSRSAGRRRARESSAAGSRCRASRARAAAARRSRP